VSHLVYRHFEPRSALSSVLLLLVIPSLLSRLISYTGRSPYTAVPLAFTAYGGALIFFTVAYRLSPFHPLAKYPGPVIAKTSKWWAAYYVSSRGDLHRYYKRLHDRYGDVVRTGQDRCLPFSSFIYQLTHFQALTSSPFAMLPLFTPYSAKVACPKDHVCPCHLYTP
jgi:hypothetical protein